MIPNFYEWKNYKLFFAIPLVLIILSLALIFTQGIPQGIDLKGGFLVTVTTDEEVNSAALESALSPYASSVEVRSFESPAGKGFEAELGVSDNFLNAEALANELNQLNSQLDDAILNKTIATATEDAELEQQYDAEIQRIDAELSSKSREMLSLIGSNAQLSGDGKAQSAQALEAFARFRESFRDNVIAAIQNVVPIKEYSVKEVGSTLSRFFGQRVREIVLVSFILSAIIIFVIFRKIVPSLAVIFGAAADIIITLGLMSLLNIPLSLATTAALLMLVGFSLDTDMLLTIRLLRHKDGTMKTRAFETMKTAFLMNLPTVGAFCVLAIAGYMLQIQTYYEIGLIAVLGGIVDYAATWFGNAIMMLHYLEGKEAKQ